jgi:hypothetical protein
MFCLGHGTSYLRRMRSTRRVRLWSLYCATAAARPVVRETVGPTITTDRDSRTAGPTCELGSSTFTEASGQRVPISPRLRALPRTRRSQDGIYREMDSATKGWPELSGLPRPIRGLARAAAKQQLRTGQTRAFRRRSLSRRAQRRLRGPKGGPTRTDAAFLSTPRPGRSRTRPRVRRCHGPR